VVYIRKRPGPPPGKQPEAGGVSGPDGGIFAGADYAVRRMPGGVAAVPTGRPFRSGDSSVKQGKIKKMAPVKFSMTNQQKM
jgi:hypothetical protein